MKRLTISCAMLLLLAGCTPQPPQHERAVARIDGRILTRGDLDAYLSINLAATETSQRAAGSDEGNLVRSRLLDTWIDERLVLTAATERQLTVADQHLDDLLDDPAYEAGNGDRESRRKFLRDRLLIELMQSMVLQDIEPPALEEAEARLENLDTSDGDRRVQLRSLRFDDAEQAKKVHQSLRRNRMTFGEAIVQNSEDESQGVPTTLELSTLPPEVREAIADLRPGWSSVPVELGGSTYLFQVAAWSEPGARMRVENTREEMFTESRRAAWKAFVADLRERAEIKIVQKNLPFRYVPASSP